MKRVRRSPVTSYTYISELPEDEYSDYLATFVNMGIEGDDLDRALNSKISDVDYLIEEHYRTVNSSKSYDYKSCKIYDNGHGYDVYKDGKKLNQIEYADESDAEEFIDEELESVTASRRIIMC